ncbi:MAG: T9SS type A sorting domain-containing protein, partial [Bacteroidota bacterium]
VASGDYYVQSVTSACTSAQSSNTTVTVYTKPNKPTIYSASLSFCPGGNATLYAFANDKAEVGYFSGDLDDDGFINSSDREQARFNNPKGMAYDASGNLFVADAYNHAIRKITPAGVVSTFAGGTVGFTNGTGTGAKFNIPLDIVIDAANNLYVLDQNNYAIRKITSAGVVTTFAGGVQGFLNGTGTGAKFGVLENITIDASGNIYAADYQNRRIRKITSAGVVSTYAGTGTAAETYGPAATSSFLAPFGLGSDAAGNLYVSDNYKIKKISTDGTVSFLAGSTYGFADGNGSSAKFSDVSDIITDNNNNLYVSDLSNKRVRKITPSGFVSTFAGGSNTYFSYAEGTYFRNLGYMARNAQGQILMSDGNNIKIATINTPVQDYKWSNGETGQSITVSADANYTVEAISSEGCTSVVSTAAAVSMIQLTNPVISSSAGLTLCGTDSLTLTSNAVTGNVWSNGKTTQSIRVGATGTYYLRNIISACTSSVTDSVKITRTQTRSPLVITGQDLFCEGSSAYLYSEHIPTATVSTYAGFGAPTTDGDVSVASITRPYGLTYDASGNMFISDSYYHRIRKISATGQVSTFAGSGSYGSANGVGTSASFYNPGKLATDAAGNVYVADIENYKIRKITPTGSVTTFAGSTQGTLNGTGTAAKFSYIVGLAFDNSGDLFVCEPGNRTIRKISPTGVVSSFLGSNTLPGGSVDGTGADVRFSNLNAICYDKKNSVFYVIDQTAVRKITAAGVVTTIAGSQTAGNIDGIGTSARFKDCFGITVDGGGNIYVSQFDRVRKITPAGVVTTLAGVTQFGYTSVNGYENQAMFNQLVDVVFNAKDSSIYAAEYGANLIRKIKIEPEFTGYNWSNGSHDAGIFVTAGGTYYLSTYNGTCTTTSTPYVVTMISKPAKPTITASGPLSICPGESVTLTASAGTFYSWSNGVRTSSITVSSAGKYSLRTYNYYCYSAYSDTVTVSIVPLATPVITASGPLSVCEGGTVTLSSPAAGAYKWSNNATTQSITVAAGAGSFTVRTINGACTSGTSAPSTVTLLPVTKPEISTPNGTVICGGGNITLTASAADTYIWSNGASTQSITVSAAGTFSVQTTGQGCTSLVSNAVTVTSGVLATPTITADGPLVICAGNYVTLTSSADINNHWSNGATGKSITVSAPGNYTVYTVSGSCTSATSSASAVSFAPEAGQAGAVTGATTVTQGTTGSYSIAAISNATSYNWTYTGTGVTITGSGTSVSLAFAADAVSGILSVSGSTTCGTGASTDMIITVNPAETGSTDLVIATDRSLSGTYSNVIITGTPTVTLDGDLEITGNIVVPDGVTFNTGCHLVTGSGSFTLEAGGTLKICNSGGIAQTGNTGSVRTSLRAFSNDANYEFNGSTPQVTGSGMPERVRNLTLSNAAGLTLSNATSVVNTLTLSAGNFNLNGNALTLLSSKTVTARLAEVPAGAGFSNASAFTVQRRLDSSAVRNELSGFGAYYWMAAGVNNATVDSWNTIANPYVFTSYDGASRYGSVWLYNSSNNTVPVNGGWFKPSAPTIPVNPGTGARVWFGNAFFASGATASLTQSPFYGNLSLNVNYCEGGNCAGNTTSNGWSLVGNPYASNIDWNSANWTKTDMANSVYIWRHKQNAYSSYVNGVGTMGGSNLIASGQGFMVRALSSSANLSIKESVKTAATVSSIREGALSLLRLKVQAGELYDEAVIVDREGSERAFEAANDAGKYLNPNLNIWAEPSLNSKQAIASMMPVAGDTVALRLKSSSSQTAFLNADDFSDWTERFSIYVRDDRNGNMQALTPGSRIAYQLTAGQVYNLTLVLQPVSVTGTAVRTALTLSVSPNPNSGSFTLNGSNEMESVQIFDNLGRLVHAQTLNGTAETLQLNLPAGVYMAKAGMKNGTAVSKLVIE